MRVVYSIGSRLAGGGIGTTAFHAVRGIFRAGHLARVICLGYEPTVVRPAGADSIPVSERRSSSSAAPGPTTSEIPVDLVRSLWFPSRRYLRLPPLHYFWFKDRSYDRRAAKLVPEGTEIFHGWNSHCLASLGRAKALGAVTFVERGSAHSAVQTRLLEEEAARFGLRPPPELRKLSDRCIAEYELADYIHVPSEFVRRSFIEAGFPPQKLVEGPYGVDAARFQPSPLPREFTALFVGNIGLQKGAPDLLEAWARAAMKGGGRLVLLGWVEDEAKRLVESYRSRCAFETPGFASDVAAAYARASVVVLPSIQDGYPLVVLEAMASGRPVIVSENTGTKDAVREGVDGFIVPIRSPEAIAQKLVWCRDHPAELAEMGRAARERAEEFPWERHGRELVAAYENALGSRR